MSKLKIMSICFSLFSLAFTACSANRDVEVTFRVMDDYANEPIENADLMRSFYLSSTDLSSNADGSTPKTGFETKTNADGKGTLTLIQGKYTSVTASFELAYMRNQMFFMANSGEPAAGEKILKQDLSDLKLIVGHFNNNQGPSSDYCTDVLFMSSSSTNAVITVYKASGNFVETDELKILKVNGAVDVAGGADLATSVTAIATNKIMVYLKDGFGSVENASGFYHAAIPIDETLDDSSDQNQYDVVLNGISQRVKVKRCRSGQVTTVVFSG